MACDLLLFLPKGRGIFSASSDLSLIGQLHLNRHSVQLSPPTPPVIVSRERREKPGPPPSSPATPPTTVHGLRLSRATGHESQPTPCPSSRVTSHESPVTSR